MFSNNEDLRQVLLSYAKDASIRRICCFKDLIEVYVVNADRRVRKDTWRAGEEGWITAKAYGVIWYQSDSFITKSRV